MSQSPLNRVRNRLIIHVCHLTDFIDTHLFDISIINNFTLSVRQYRHHSMYGCLNLFFLFIINIYSFRSGGGFVKRLFSLTYFIKRKRICCFF